MSTNSEKKQTLPVVRSNIEDGLRSHNYRDILRIDFYFSCGYCSITEIEATGIGFQIDHYFPRDKYPQKENEYLNLIYSCQKCNSTKSDFYPGQSGLPKELHIIRPDEEDPGDHYALDKDELVGKTELGRFNINCLRLNRRALKIVRKLRERLWISNKYIAFGVSELKKLKLDNLPGPLKKALFKYRADLTEQQKKSIDSIEKFIEAVSRSELLDVDPDKISHVENRKQYLKSLKAINKY